MRKKESEVLISFLFNFFEKKLFIIMSESLNLISFLISIRFLSIYKIQIRNSVYLCITNKLYSIYSFFVFVNFETRLML